MQGGFLQYDTPDQIQAYTLQAPYAACRCCPTSACRSATVGDAAMRALTTPGALSAFAGACVASSVAHNLTGFMMDFEPASTTVSAAEYSRCHPCHCNEDARAWEATQGGPGRLGDPRQLERVQGLWRNLYATMDYYPTGGLTRKPVDAILGAGIPASKLSIGGGPPRAGQSGDELPRVRQNRSIRRLTSVVPSQQGRPRVNISSMVVMPDEPGGHSRDERLPQGKVGDCKTDDAPSGSTLYISNNGSDSADDGPASAWKSLRKARAAVLQRAARCMARGSVWRGQLHIQTGNAAPDDVRRVERRPCPAALRRVAICFCAVRLEPSTRQRHVWVMDSVGAKYAEIMDRDASSEFDLRDIGNLILGGEKSVGWRVWAPAELKQDVDYAASINSHLRGHNETKLLFFSPAGNPAVVHGFDRVRVDELRGGRPDQLQQRVERDCRVAGGQALGIVCDGRREHERFPRRPTATVAGEACIEPGPRWRNPLECTRYGNGLDVWEWAYDVEIARNRVWEVYDTGFTNQGTADNYTGGTSAIITT